MLEFINAIPENIGWAMVGSAATVCAIMWGKLIALVVTAIKERLEDDEEEGEHTAEKIKCPNCGSSAQLTLLCEDRYGYDTSRQAEYECDCGCWFETTFQLTETKIIERKGAK